VDLTNALAAAVLPAGDTAKKLLSTALLENLKGMGTANLVPSVLIGLLTFAATVLVYLELVVRVVLLKLLEALAPLSFAPMVWAPARQGARKVGELAVAVLLSQPAIFLALRIGLDFLHEHATATPGGVGAWGRLLLGLGVLSVATFCPWVIWRLLPHAEGMLLSQGLSRSPARGALSAMQTAYWVSALRSTTRGTPGAALASAGPNPGTGSGLGPPRSLPSPRPTTSHRRPPPGPSPSRDRSGAPDGAPDPAGNPAAGPGRPGERPPGAGKDNATGSTHRAPSSPTTARSASAPYTPPARSTNPGTAPPTPHPPPTHQPPPGRSPRPSTPAPHSPPTTPNAPRSPSAARAGNPAAGGIAAGWSRRKPNT
jgi:hypothetical protein